MARPPNLSKLSISALEALINDRRRGLKSLYKRRTKLQRDLSKLDAQIASLGGESGGVAKRGGPGSRARNEKPLTDVIDEVLRAGGKPMGVPAITEAVLATGFKSNSASFKGLVNQALIKDKRFTSAERGIYQLKK